MVCSYKRPSLLKNDSLDELQRLFEDKDGAVRYWAAMGILMRGADAVRATKATLDNALGDASPYVRAIAAEALGRYGDDADAAKALEVLLELADLDHNSVFVSMLAVNAIDAMDDRAAGAIDRIKALPKRPRSAPPRVGGYVGNLINKTLADLK